MNMQGIELLLPKGWELFVELRQNWLGFGSVNYGDDREIFLGFAQITISRTRGERGGKCGLAAIMTCCFLVGLAIPSWNAKEAIELFKTSIMQDAVKTKDADETGLKPLELKQGCDPSAYPVKPLNPQGLPI